MKDCWSFITTVDHWYERLLIMYDKHWSLPWKPVDHVSQLLIMYRIVITTLPIHVLGYKIERINKDMQLILYSPEYLGQHTEGRYIADIRLQTNKWQFVKISQDPPSSPTDLQPAASTSWLERRHALHGGPLCVFTRHHVLFQRTLPAYFPWSCPCTIPAVLFQRTFPCTPSVQAAVASVRALL